MVVHSDYTSAMDACDRAIQVLKAGSFAQVKESLLQVQAFDRIPAQAKQTIMSFLQGGADPSEAMLEESILSESGAKVRQTPKTYESSSGGIIGMVESLADKLKDERYELEKEE